MCFSKPKVPQPTPVVERQAYSSPVPRDSLSTADPNRRRHIAGVTTSTQGVAGPASTTGRVLLGGDNPMLASLGGGPPASPAVQAVAANIAATRGGQSGGGSSAGGAPAGLVAALGADKAATAYANWQAITGGANNRSRAVASTAYRRGAMGVGGG